MFYVLTIDFGRIDESSITFDDLIQIFCFSDSQSAIDFSNFCSKFYNSNNGFCLYCKDYFTLKECLSWLQILYPCLDVKNIEKIYMGGVEQNENESNRT